MAMVGFVLLIACANVADLLLARGAALQREFAMRIAIGAGRGRLIRQLLTESLLLAGSGAAAGLLLAHWADALLLRMVSGASSGPPSIHLDLQPDARVLGFTLGVTLLTTILFGLLPSLYSTRLDLTPVLKSTPAGTPSEALHRRFPAGKILVVTQVAVSIILLVSAGLFVRSLSKLGEVKLGYNRENLILFRVDATPGGDKGAAIPRFQLDLLARISAIPGLRGATVSKNGLFSGSESADPIAVEGYTPKAGEEMHSRMDHVGPGYFSTLGITILMGREIEAQDTASSVRAAVINQTFASRFFPNTNPIGKRVGNPYPGHPAEMVVVGVAADAKYNNLREKANPRIYAPIANPMWENSAAVYEVRTYADPQAVAAALRQVVQEAAPTLPPNRNPHHVRAYRRLGANRPLHRATRQRFQPAGSASRCRWPLRPDGLHGIPPHSRHRHSPGARCRAGEHSVGCPARDSATCAPRRRYRRAGRPSRSSLDQKHALRPRPFGSHFDLFSRDPDGDHSGVGGIPARAARFPGRSDGGPAL